MEPEEVVIEGTMEDGTSMNDAVDEIASSALPHEDIGTPEGETEAKGDAPAAKGPTAPSGEPTKGALGDGQPAPAPGDLTPPAEYPTAPDSLTGDLKEMWANLDPKVQAEFVKREEDFRNFYEQVKQPVELGQGYAKMLEPYLGVMRQYGVNPVEHTENLLKYHAILMFGNPQQKAEILSGLATDAGLDLRALAAGAIQSLPQNVTERQLAEMRAQLQNVGSKVSQQDSAKLEGEIVQMAENTKDYPHFWELAPAMIQELNANPRLPIDQAYRLALSANKALFDSVMNSRAAEKAAKEARDAQARAEAARKARGVKLQSSSPVRPASAASKNARFDIGDAVEDAFREMQSR
jgi:uncharacterized protein with GYD domain